MAIGWGLLNDKWLAFLPVAFMAWGDNAAGLSRDTIWRDRPAKLWPSVVMLVVCLGIAVLYQPFWISAIGAGVATSAERYRPRSIRFWDDNLNLVAASLFVMTFLTKATLWKISLQ
jgi:dolichol kinase